MAEDKKYIIVGNAIRKYIDNIGTSSPFECHPKLVVKDSHYRKGELGLIHPAINDFFADYHENVKKAGTIKDKDGKPCGYQLQNSFPYFMSAGDLSGFFYEREHQKENLPCLMYNHETYDKPGRYFLSLLRKGEFEQITGTDFESVNKQIKEFYEKEKISNHVYESELNEQWRHLECFDTLMKDRIHKIPVEVARFDIPEEELRSREKNLIEAAKRQMHESGFRPSPDIFKPLHDIEFPIKRL